MRKTALATILLAAGMALAQTSATPSTVQGCLSGASGNYTFTDQSGKSWTLTGSTDNLKDHVGNTVQITGNEDTTNNSISVADVKDISQGCNQATTSSMGNQTSAASTSAAGTQTTTTAGTQPAYPPEGAQTSTSTATSSNQMGASNSVQGCLAEAAGSFTITDQSGKSWTVNGDSNELQKHVGNTVQITGSQDTTNNTITVSNVSDVSQGCKQGAAASSSSTAAAGTAGTQPPTSPTDTAQVTQPGTNPEEAPGTNSEDIRKNPAQSDIPSGQAQTDVTNNPPTFGKEQNPNTSATATEQQPAQTPAQTESSTTAATSTEQQPAATEHNPSMTAQNTPAEQPSTSATPSTAEQNEPAATEQNEQATANQNATAAQGTANQQAATKRGQLPQTASPLPLLLLLGFGSLAGAFFAFRRVKA